MITLLKLKEYEEYHGYYDGFYMQKIRNGTNLTSNDEWFLISSLVQDIRLTQQGLVSKEFAEQLTRKLKESCDSEETINRLKSIVDNDW